VVEVFEISKSDDGLTFSPFETFAFGDVLDLANYVKFRVTLYGDFDTDDYRLRGFSGIADDATLVEGGFGLSPFGRFPFGDGGVCLEDENTDLPQGLLSLSGSLQVLVDQPNITGDLALSGDLEAVFSATLAGSLALSGDLDVEVFVQEEGALNLSGSLQVLVSPPVSGSMSLSGDLTAEIVMLESGSLALSGDDQVSVFLQESGSMSMSGNLASVLSNAFAILGGFGPSANVGSGQTIYISPTPDMQTVNLTTEAAAAVKIPIAITISSIYVVLTGTLGSGVTLTFKYVVNGTPSSGIVLTMNTASGTSASASGTVSLAAGDTLSIQIVSSGNALVGVQSCLGQYQAA
jgi:hypothetical protein